jgi:hypothetical protein
MILRTTSQIGILLFACAALSACAWPGWNDSAPAADANADVASASGTAVFKTVEPNLRRAVATHEGRDIVMYWDDQTIFVRGGKATRVSSKIWVAETPAAKAPVGTMPSSAAPPSGQYYKENKVMADIDPPKPGEIFEFRGFKTHGQIALRIISFK